MIYGNSLDIISLRDRESEEILRSIAMPDDAFILTAKEDNDCLWLGTDSSLYRLSSEGELEKIEGLHSYMMSLDMYGGTSLRPDFR